MAGLRLVASEVGGRGSWLWRLLGPGDKLIAHHQVGVQVSSWEWQALADLPTGLSTHLDPADQLGSEEKLVAQVGDWTADKVLGPLAAILADRAPVAVSVLVPASAPWLLGLPLGVARVGGEYLVTHGVAFAGSFEGQEVVAKDPVGERLRVLAVFSVPAGQSLLDLRRERKGLGELVAEVAGGGTPRALDLRVLQYGATAERLREALDEDEGWDVVHFAGHGEPGRLMLEDEAGKPTVVDTAELVKWLRKARHRLKLVSLSACSSGAFVVAQTLKDMDVEAHDLAPEPTVGASHGLALEVMDRAETTVVAMRYPVVDDFAIAFGLALFRGLWDKGKDTAAATAWALERSVTFPPTAAAPALAAFTPAVFGPAAGALHLAPPEGTPQTDLKMAGFDAEPARFVGRVAVMTRANAALARHSPQRGVVLHGMAGAGKTACALELAYGQRGNFAELVWCRCPNEGTGTDKEAADALGKLAGRLDTALRLPLAGKADKLDQIEALAEQISEAMENTSVLVVLDNVESLLSAQGSWLDPRWKALVTALVTHPGRGRVVLTSRRPPTGLDGLAVEAVHALGPHEAVLLARQLPNLSRLLKGETVATRDSGPALVRAVLEATGGHPKLLELANAQVGTGPVLDAMLADAAQQWQQQGVDPSAFLTAAGRGVDKVAGYVALVGSWANQALAGLDEAAVLMLQFLVRADAADRDPETVRVNWADLWRRLGRPEPAPEPGPVLQALMAAALVEADPGGSSFTIHPLVAETVAAATPEEVAAAVDTELAAAWGATLQQALADEAAGQPTTGWVIHAARQGAIYFIRLRDWMRAQAALEEVLLRDPSPAGRADGARQLRHIATKAVGTEAELLALGVLARALRDIDPTEAERLMRRVEADDEAAAAGRHQLAAGTSSDLANLLMAQGRYRETLDVIDRTTGHIRAAGLGPWTQLLNQIKRLQVLRALGQYERVLDEATRSAEHLGELPDPPTDNEAVNPWNVREMLFDTARQAAADLGRWQEALAWLERVVASEQDRDAPELERASALFNAYGPLLRLGRIAETSAVLADCRVVFERHDAFDLLGQCLCAQADVADKQGFGPQAVVLERRALRYKYLRPGPREVAVSHYNLANYLDRGGGEGASLGHRLASTMLSLLTGHGDYPSDVAVVARQLASGVSAPASFDELCLAVEVVDGVQFRALVEALGGDGTHVLATVIDDARQLPVEALYAFEIAGWEPTLALLVAASSGNTYARAHLDAELARRSEQPDWRSLAERLSRVSDGERDPSLLGEGLDPIDTTIVSRALAALAGEVEPDPAPEDWAPLLDAVAAIAAARRAGTPLAPALEEVATEVAASLDEGAEKGWTALAARLRQLADGAADVEWEGLDSADTAVLITVMRRIEQRGAADGGGPSDS